MRDATLSSLEGLALATAGARLDDDTLTFCMDEDAFRLFYDRTARPVWAYLARITGDRQLADDLMQESYFRFLRSRAVLDDEAHRRNYLFRIATNLAHDVRRRAPMETATLDDGIEHDHADPQSEGDATGRAVQRLDLRRAMRQLKPRERSLLWLAYAQGSSHVEIAQALGLKTGSIKPLLFRARRRLSALLQESAR
ncbi:MAG: sigma-70 family RNA polymerase sigma factor [Acidobacteria bacterium]|nr:sigma-70 family RNA polymerase sigma factor [Acidobacteriota bacterium]